MIHELNLILKKAKENQDKGIKNVLATVVHLEGSSYRKPGVRMLLSENDEMVGAVSGGCVEKEILRQAQSVLTSGQSKMMTYDGRFRLGCEGVIYILIEPILLSDDFLDAYKELEKKRIPIQIKSYFLKGEYSEGNYGSIVEISGKGEFRLSDTFDTEALEDLNVFNQELSPNFKLLIIGGEHDSVKLCAMAHLLGWEIHVVTSIKDPKPEEHFAGAISVEAIVPESFSHEIDKDTAVVLMTHSYSQDLKYLMKLQHFDIPYLGIIGSLKRKQQLENELLDFYSNIELDFLDKIRSPAGLNIGAETPEEIALSILSEILSVIRGRKPLPLSTLLSKVSH